MSVPEEGEEKKNEGACMMSGPRLPQAGERGEKKMARGGDEKDRLADVFG